MTSRVRGTLARYGLAAGAVVAVSLLRLPLHHLTWPEAPYLLFAVAVLVAAAFGGFGPGLLAVSLSVVAGNFFFAVPYFRLDFQAPTQTERAVVFVIDGILISILGGRLRTARQHEETAAREARTLQAEILEIAERERARFGHDLHDGLGQHLTATALLAGALARRLQGPEDRDSANRIASLLDQAVEQTRDLARGLAPMSLRIGGLPAAIEELGASAQRLFGVPCETECDPTVEVPDEDIAVHLYRVAQEAITNAAKHGGPPVRVALHRVNGSIELEVSDHGVGFDPNNRGYEGVGLKFMAYRAARGSQIDHPERAPHRAPPCAARWRKERAMPKARVLLIDDHPLLRQGLAQLINQENDLILCGEAEDAPSAMNAIQRLAPDIAVVDLTLKDSSGTDLIKQLAQTYPSLKMLVFSMHDESLHAERTLQSGARGYVMKHEEPGQVLEAIRRVLAGEIYLSQRMSARVLNRLAGGKGQKDQSPISALSDRELQIFTMIGQGTSSREIAEALSVSVKTIETHRERIKGKLNLKNATELLRCAMRYTHNL